MFAPVFTPGESERLIRTALRRQVREREATGLAGGVVGEETFELARIGWVESPLDDVTAAPKQGIEGAPDAFLVFHSRFEKALQDVEAGDEIVVLTWLHRARRDVLRLHPRDNPATPLRGVFSTRSADRPNPTGLHRVQVLENRASGCASGTSRPSTGRRCSM